MTNINADRDYIRKAIELADLDAVRIALYHNTGDERFAALPLAPAMDDAQRRQLIDEAVDWLAENAGPRELPEPPEAQLRHMMNLATDEEMGDLEFAARRDQTSFTQYPFLTEWEGEKPDIPEGFNVAIIGSGFSGIVIAIQCKLLGIPYVVYERQPELGGTWNINRYPDVRVDTVSLIYELNFEKNYRWKEYFGRGEEVRQYLDHVSRKYGVFENTKFNHDMTDATFDESRNLWQLQFTTADGPKAIEANVMISATGLFANPMFPNIDGKEDFTGDLIHPSRWPRDLSLKGKRVAIIGNGSTGVQMVGAIAKEAAQTYVFQRTPQWISPREQYDEEMEPEIHWLMDNFPGYWNWCRYFAGAPLFDTHALVCTDEDWKAKGGKVNPRSDALRDELKAYIEAETGGRQDIIDRVTPDYAPFSRRPVVDNGWYRALVRDDVELVTDSIDRITPEGIETADGKVRELDVIITATGFDIVKYLWPAKLTGREGTDLHESWDKADGPRAYIGMMVPQFPNMFMFYGPNSQAVSTGPSQATWFTIWAAFVGRCLKRMIREGHTSVEVTREAYESYNQALDKEAENLVMMTVEGGIEQNYYVNNDHGRVQVNAPWYGPVYQQMFKDIDWDALELGKVKKPVDSA